MGDTSKLVLPSNMGFNIYLEFQVIKEILATVQVVIAPWGDLVDGDLQYEIPMLILQLIKDEYGSHIEGEYIQ